MHACRYEEHIRHDAMMRMLVKEFTKGSKGSHYLIADVGTVDTLNNIGVHNKGIPKFVLPDAHIQHTTQNIASCVNALTCSICDGQKKTRPDMLIVEMTYAEQQSYHRHWI